MLSGNKKALLCGAAFLAVGVLLCALGVAPCCMEQFGRLSAVLVSASEAHRAFAAAVLFFAIAILPAFLLPVTPLLPLCGAALGAWAGVAVAELALLANAAITYRIAISMRGPVSAWIGRRGFSGLIPCPASTDLLVIPLRANPAIPYVVKNYLLGLGGASWGRYLLWTAILETATSAPVVLLGAGALRSELNSIAWAVFIGASALAVVSIVRRRFSAAPGGALGD